MRKVVTIALDIARSVFQGHGIKKAGEVVVRQRLDRARVPAFFEKLSRCLVGGGVRYLALLGAGADRTGADLPERDLGSENVRAGRGFPRPTSRKRIWPKSLQMAEVGGKVRPLTSLGPHGRPGACSSFRPPRFRSHPFSRTAH
jgi:hypothetical protein